MMLLQAVQTFPDGPAWLAAAAVSVPSLLGAVKLGMGLRNGGSNGKTHEPGKFVESEKAIEFRATTNATLSRLTNIADRQTDTMALLVRTMDRLGERVDDHDGRTADAIKLVGATHQIVQAVARKVNA